MIGGALVALGGIGFVYPVMAMEQRLQAAIGASPASVREVAGAPVREWKPGEFRCAEGWPCSARCDGAVMLYTKWDRGWYLCFDRNEKLVSIEESRT
jgi:hypothetical protein